MDNKQDGGVCMSTKPEADEGVRKEMPAQQCKGESY